MRIVHVTDCYLPRVGGIEMHVHDLAQRQRAAGHDVRVVTVTPAADGVPDPAWVRRIRQASATVPHRIGLSRQVAEALAGADAVHVHVSVISPFAFGAARQAAAAGLPVLVTVHSLWSRLGVLPAWGSAVAGLRSWRVQWSAVSEPAAAPVRRVLGPGVPVLVLPNAVDPARWQVTPRPPAVPTVVSVMRLTRTKRTLPLARILRQVRAELPAELPLRAVIVGDGPQRGALERYLDRHSMRDWVELPGVLDRPAIREVFAASSLYVAPAELESFGIAALEARCAGLPVVASSHGGIGGFITPGVDGLLGETDEEMAAALVRLLTDHATATAMAEHNRRVPSRFDWPAALADSLAGYEQAARVAGRRTMDGARP